MSKEVGAGGRFDIFLDSVQKFSPLLRKKKQQNRLQEHFFQGWQKAGALLPKGGSWHPVPPHGYGPG